MRSTNAHILVGMAGERLDQLMARLIGRGIGRDDPHLWRDGRDVAEDAGWAFRLRCQQHGLTAGFALEEVEACMVQFTWMLVRAIGQPVESHRDTAATLAGLLCDGQYPFRFRNGVMFTWEMP